MIYIYSGKRLHEADSLTQALKLEKENLPGTVSGYIDSRCRWKTTTLHRLADEYVCVGVPVLVTTTTHIMKEDREWFLSGFSEEKIKEQLQKAGQVWVGEPAPGGKLEGFPTPHLRNF